MLKKEPLELILTQVIFRKALNCLIKDLKELSKKEIHPELVTDEETINRCEKAKPIRNIINVRIDPKTNKRSS